VNRTHERQLPQYTQTHQHGETMTAGLNFILRFFRQRKPWVAGLRYDGRKPGMAPSRRFSAAFNVAGRLLVRDRWARIWRLLPNLVVGVGSSPSFGVSRDVISDVVTAFQSASCMTSLSFRALPQIGWGVHLETTGLFGMIRPPTTCDSVSRGHLGYGQDHDASFAWHVTVDGNTSNKPLLPISKLTLWVSSCCTLRRSYCSESSSGASASGCIAYCAKQDLNSFGSYCSNGSLKQ
jgi:hypothetical protein